MRVAGGFGFLDFKTDRDGAIAQALDEIPGNRDRDDSPRRFACGDGVCNCIVFSTIEQPDELTHFRILVHGKEQNRT
ncbi:hypothetical protein D3C77_587950 [compost metagenome]